MCVGAIILAFAEEVPWEIRGAGYQYPTKVLNKSVLQLCQESVLNTSVYRSLKKECPSRVSSKNVGVFYRWKSVLEKYY